MSVPELLSYPDLGLIAAVCVAVLVLLAGTVALAVRALRATRELERLRSEVRLFSEASIRVADTLDALLRGEVDSPRGSQPSRRHLLLEARDALEHGEGLIKVGERLGLSDDEVSLLRRVPAARAA